MFHLNRPKNGETVSGFSKEQRSFLEKPAEIPIETMDWYHLRKSKDDFSKPEPIRFSYTPAVDGEIVLRQMDKKGSCVREILLQAEMGEAAVYNLLLDTEYSWFVRTEEGESECSSFRTEDLPPRVLWVDGVSNIRDIGGYKTADGKRVRQGRVYRTSELAISVPGGHCTDGSHPEITEAGKQTMADLGVRVDLDFRGFAGDPCCPVLDTETTRWLNYPMGCYEEFFLPSQAERCRESYRLLTSEENLPMIVHCWAGIDRAGTWIYVLGALLGVAEEDLAMDYEFSSLARWGYRSRHSDAYRELKESLLQYGPTLQEAAEKYLLSCGLTVGEMQKIRELMLEDVTA